MIDLVKLELLAGDGGHGRVAFRREKYVPKGGPSGGNGGAGGHVIIRGNRHLSSLDHLIGEKIIEAEHGQAGAKSKRHGAKGKNAVIEVPVGTTIWLLAENSISQARRQRYELDYLLSREEVKPEKYYLETMGEFIPPRAPDQVQPILTEDQLTEDQVLSAESPAAADSQTEIAQLKRQARLLKKVLNSSSDSLKGLDFKHLPKQKILEITADQEEIVLCQGGFGGRGNNSFKGPENTTPLEAEYGTTGEKKVVIFEQQLLADVGLVGFPNAGKSTLISVLTEARPKTADYPFTTLEPQLGVLKLPGKPVQELVMADIPGLIEGASQGKGLGHAFLRHVEHCRLLLLVLFLPEAVIFDEALSTQEKAQQLKVQWQALQTELKNYGHELQSKPQLIVINKVDLYAPELVSALKDQFDQEVSFISAVNQTNLKSLQTRLRTFTSVSTGG